MSDGQSTNLNDYLALELGRKELANVLLRARLAAAQAQIRELEGEKAPVEAEEPALVT